MCSFRLHSQIDSCDQYKIALDHIFNNPNFQKTYDQTNKRIKVVNAVKYGRVPLSVRYEYIAYTLGVDSISNIFKINRNASTQLYEELETGCKNSEAITLSCLSGIGVKRRATIYVAYFRKDPYTLAAFTRKKARKNHYSFGTIHLMIFNDKNEIIQHYVKSYIE